MDCEKIPKIDSRGYEDIIEEIALKARKYTPEWKFSPDNPDAGTALACVFARRTAESIEKFNRTLRNHKRSFYNMLGAQALPAVPASGYVRFALSGAIRDGVFVKEGFRLFSPVIDELGTRLSFETTQSAWLTPAVVKELIYADAGSDTVCFCDGMGKPSYSRGNSNQRYLSFKHKLLGNLTDNCRLYMTITGADGRLWAERLSDPDNARFVSVLDGNETETNCYNDNGRIRIETGSCEEIKAEIKNVAGFESLSFGGISIDCEGINIKPDSVFANGELENDGAFYAFGEAPNVYDTVYIESAAALSKPGAAVTLAFTVDFEVTAAGDIPAPDIPDRLFVRKSSVRPPERKTITVDEVIWEYWNGAGFASIRGLEDYRDIFSGIDKAGAAVKKSRCKLTFTCPPDISPVMIGAAQRLCVRARIKRIKNAYALPSESYVPRIENILVSYKYNEPAAAENIRIMNNCEESAVVRMHPFSRLEETALYIGLDNPARAFTLLVCVGEPSNCLKSAEWSVFSDNGWENVTPSTSDEATGFFSFELERPPAERALFGRTAYWIKAKPSGGEGALPDNLLLNCVPVVQREKIESFCSDSEVESINLNRKNILDLQIQINTAKRNREERWEELPEGWSLDKAGGKVFFSPVLSLAPNSRTVKLNYTCGGGAAGNLPEGQDFVPALSDGSIVGASNPFPLIGGCDCEDEEHTEQRLAGELRHRNLPITKRDFEELLAGREILSARVLANSSGGIDVEVEAARGVSAEDIQSMVYSRLSGILPLGIGTVNIRIAESADT